MRHRTPEERQRERLVDEMISRATVEPALYAWRHRPKVGQLVQRYIDENPDVDLSKLTADDLNKFSISRLQMSDAAEEYRRRKDV